MKNTLAYCQYMYRILRDLFKPTWQYFKYGYQAHLLKPYCKQFISHRLREYGMAMARESEELKSLEGVRIQRLHQQVAGLHALLPKEEIYSYSILIVAENTKGTLLKKTLSAALKQTAPQLEVLVGYSDSLSQEVVTLIQELQKSFPNLLQGICLSDKTEAERLNQLAQRAKGHFLLPLKEGDWIRPDFLFRCEQFLRLLTPSHPVCLYTDEFSINAHDYPFPGGYWQKPKALHFPYVFKDEIGHSLLIPRLEWLKVGGLQRHLLAQGLWDLALRLDREGVSFQHIPFPLYAYRSDFSRSIEDKPHFLEQLEAATQAKGLQWTWQEGLLPTSFRAIPKLEEIPSIQVIIPFKNQKELTLKAVRSVLRQIGVHPLITAVDNGSEDRSIAWAIEQLGGEVLTIQEPFNYSRLNNLAVERTQIAQGCEYLLFLNNDVELEEDALQEMCRWAAQPSIGWVGCQLCYPNGLLQHGGVELGQEGPSYRLNWKHSEKFRPPFKMSVSKMLRVVDAVTAACALMRRSLFIELGGFDEIWYPISYGDTNFAAKLKQRGFKCLYTPYARGIHYESASRQYENIEDVEASRWLHELVMARQTPPF